MPPEVYAIDFETFYDSSYSLREMSVSQYVNDPRFDAYLVAIIGPGVSYSGSPEKAPWDKIANKIWVSHNMAFDFQVWQRLLELGKVKEGEDPAEWHCTANLCAYLQAPRSLKDAMKALYNLEMSKDVRDDMKGLKYRLIPPSAREAWDEYALVDSEYCLRLWNDYSPCWPESERKISFYTIMDGYRGINVDWDGLEDAQKAMQRATFEALDDIPWVRDGFKALSLKAVKLECAKLGISAPSSMAAKSEIFEAWLEKHGSKVSWAVAMGTVRKADKMYKSLCEIENRKREDGTIGFGLKYFGAAQTGRWSGEQGLNMQNLTKGETFGHCMRHLFIPRPGKKFVISDLSAIEPRVLAMCAGDEDFLGQMRAGMDCYEAHARTYMGYADPRPLKVADPKLRQYAKARVLGAGYGASGVSYVMIAKIMGGLNLSLIEAKNEVKSFRRTNKLTVGLWKTMDREMKDAFKNGEDMEVELPSGRIIHYFDPDAKSACRLRGGFDRKFTYGAKLVENLVQATARDIFADGYVRVAESDMFDTCWTVHDEIIAEVDEDVPDDEATREIEKIMSTPPDWAEDIPLDAEAHASYKYDK